MRDREKLEKAMQDILGLSLKNEMLEKEVERQRTTISLLQDKINAMPTRFEYWSGIIAALGLVVAIIALVVNNG